MGDPAHMLHGAEGSDNPEREGDVLSRHSTRDDRFERRQVVRMYEISNALHCDLRLWTELEDAVGFLRPVVVVSDQVRDEASRLAQSLRITEAVVGSPELDLGSLSVFDVDNQTVPMSDPTFLVTERLSHRLNPSKFTVGAAELVDILVRCSRRGRMQPPLHRRVAVIGMNEFKPASTGQGLRRVAEILDGSLIQVVEITLWSTAPHQRWNRIDDELELMFTGTQRLLCPPALVDVRQQHAPAKNLATAIADREPAVFKPAIGAIGPAKALHDLVWAAGCDRTREDVDDLRQILGMDRAVRRPLSEFVLGLAEVLEHLPIEDVEFPSCREESNHPRDRVHK